MFTILVLKKIEVYRNDSNQVTSQTQNIYQNSANKLVRDVKLFWYIFNTGMTIEDRPPQDIKTLYL